MFKGYFQFLIILMLSFFTAGYKVTAQSSVTLTNNIERAHAVLNDVYAEINYNNSVGDVKMHIRGTYKYEGLSDKPGSSREFGMSGQIMLSNGGHTLIRKDTFTRAGENTITSFYDIDDNHINVTEAEEELKLTEGDKEQYLYESLAFSPNMLLQFVLRDASRNTFISTDNKYHIIRHNNGSGNVYFLYINSSTYFLEKIDQPMYDPVAGDYFRTITYQKYDVQDGYQVPGKIIISRDSQVLYSLSVDVKEILPRVEFGTTTIAPKKIGEWLYMIPLNKWNCKSVIADMRDYLVVFEPPANPEAGYTLLDNIKQAFPGKEIRYCVVSHHHPDHMGGVRPFMEDGAIVVTTEGNRDYFQGISRNKHMFSVDVRVKKYINPKFLFVTYNKQEIKVGERVIQLYLLNKKSNHTDEYIISYIPSEKILIEGDLIKTSNLKERPLDRQEKGLVEFIEEQKINVKQMVQTWPLEKSPLIFDYELIKPESSNFLQKGTKKVLEVFE